ncbi:hypothetical protein A2572_00460 [Candidatus Collierbacteria bacterium RIFOXYD1_FULL_40_9]|uniref:Uncharacterized protein n=1 Tax=Candidatus Collierbacteria bacterium RIFOXYD1_FULL_40_9 TaxID=1817731 RepID=A0A1F5FWJ5_9BACT|nr:MAG: hypothetical protein A2572_00460 [Candidatus Collierbacteria bacterium RIFOXYD1_FULL_40_9]
MSQPKVYVDYPDSFRVIDVLNAHAVEMGFKLIDLATMKPIEGQLINLVELGITFLQPKIVAPMGFRVSDGLLKREYATQAVLKIADLQPSSDSKVQEVAWELFIEDADNLNLFLPIADLLSVEFGKTIVINLFSKDDDSAHMEPEPVDERFPNGSWVCRVVPKLNKEKE